MMIVMRVVTAIRAAARDDQYEPSQQNKNTITLGATSDSKPQYNYIMHIIPCCQQQFVSETTPAHAPTTTNIVLLRAHQHRYIGVLREDIICWA